VGGNVGLDVVGGKVGGNVGALVAPSTEMRRKDNIPMKINEAIVMTFIKNTVKLCETFICWSHFPNLKVMNDMTKQSSSAHHRYKPNPHKQVKRICI
jgi:hypothetical protein